MNVANLLLSRGAVRRPELALRASLGATPSRVVRQLFVESLVLAATGGGLGIAFGFIGVQLLDVLVPATLAGAATLAALMPAQRATRVDPLLAIRAE